MEDDKEIRANVLFVYMSSAHTYYLGRTRNWTFLTYVFAKNKKVNARMTNEIKVYL